MKDKLGNHIQQIRGVSYKPSDLSETLMDGYTTLLRANNIVDGKINLDSVQYVKKDRVSQMQILNTNDILVCSSSGSLSSIGKSAIYKKSGEHTFGAFCKVIRTTGKLYSNYLALYLRSPFYRHHIEKVANGANINNLRNEDLDEIILEIPTEAKQHAIISNMEKLQSIIESRRIQLRKLDELVKCRFVEMFGDPVQNNHNWDRYPISKIAPIAGASKPDSDPVWLLNLDMVRAQTGEIISYKYLSPDKIGASTCFFDKQNVLYSKLRPYLNKVVLPDRAGCATSELVPLRPLAMLNRLFLAHLLRSDYFVAFISDKVTGAKMPRVSMDAFKNFECICPPIDIQNAFATFVQQLDKSRFAIQRSLEETQKLFDSLMQEYFS